MGGDFAPRAPAACFGENPVNSPRRADPPPGRFFGEGGIRGGPCPIGLFSAKSRLTWRDRDVYRVAWLFRRLRGEYTENPEKSRRYAGPPSGRFCGEWVIRRYSRPTDQNSEKSPALGAIGVGLVPHGSSVDCAQFQGNEKTSLFLGTTTRPAVFRKSEIQHNRRPLLGIGRGFVLRGSGQFCRRAGES